MERGPIFIGGLGRSGKTLMRFMLSSHPDIAISRRTNMWTHFYGRYGDLGRDDNFERCLNAMLQTKHVALLRPNPGRLRREFCAGPATYARLFALLHEHYAEQVGKMRWGDQTESLERCADLILAAYPTAKMIHMIRDPRDRYQAILERRPESRIGAGGATATWLYSLHLAQRNQQQHPARYKIVRYETMVSQPEATMREVCAFLDEAYAPAMLKMERVARFQAVADEPGASPISTDYIACFRRALSESDVAFIQIHAGRKMLTHGYALETIRWTPGEWLRFWAVDWPVDLGRLLGWRTAEIMMQNIPGLFRNRAVTTVKARSARIAQRRYPL